MRATLFVAGLAMVVVMLAVRPADSQPESKKQTKPAAVQKKSDAGVPDQKPASAATKAGTPADRSADEAAVRANVAAFLKAYNAGDAKAIAALFTPDGQIVTQDGETVEGREEIEQGFDDIFAETP